MNIIEITPLIFLTIILLITTISDIRTHKIPNYCTYPAIVIGIGYYTYMNGLHGLLFSLAGLFLGLFLLILFYLKGGMGAGDVKLMGAVGVLLGPKGVFVAFLCTALIGGIYAVILLGLHGYLKESVKRYGTMLKTYIFTMSLVYLPPAKIVKMPVLPYGVAIALGTSLSFIRNVF